MLAKRERGGSKEDGSKPFLFFWAFSLAVLSSFSILVCRCFSLFSSISRVSLTLMILQKKKQEREKEARLDDDNIHTKKYNPRRRKTKSQEQTRNLNQSSKDQKTIRPMKKSPFIQETKGHWRIRGLHKASIHPNYVIRWSKLGIDCFPSLSMKIR